MEFLHLLLSWPVLVTASFWVLVRLFQNELKQLLQRGGILIEWGDKKLNVKEVARRLDSETTEIGEEIESLIQRIETLEKSLPATAKIDSKPAPADDAKRKIYQTLSNSKYTWRTLDRLANISGLDQESLIELFNQDADIVLSRNRETGKQIARWKTSS